MVRLPVPRAEDPPWLSLWNAAADLGTEPVECVLLLEDDL
jgi:hypothetical protein